jgi:hypothetical protein
MGGIVEINQAKALSGGINGDQALDPPGFPIVLTVPGSYRFTSDLVQTDPNTDVILVAVDDVTIDLAGMAIRGPVVCSGTPVACLPNLASGSGIDPGASTNLVVRNGRILGMGHGIATATSRLGVFDLELSSNTQTGLTSREAVIVVRSRADRNGSWGFQTLGASVFLDLSAEGNWIAGLNDEGLRGNVFRDSTFIGGIWGAAMFTGVARGLRGTGATTVGFGFAGCVVADLSIETVAAEAILLAGGNLLVGSSVTNSDTGLLMGANSQVLSLRNTFKGSAADVHVDDNQFVSGESIYDTISPHYS